MQLVNVPLRMTVQWAGGAVAPYVHTVPVLSQIGITPGAASFTDGFPPLNFLPVASGGVPPFGNDVNGVLNISTAWLQWLQAGGPVAFNAAFSTAVTGYPKGAFVASATLGGWWLNTIDDNTANPDAGGTNWTPIALGQAPTFTRLTSGSGSYNPQANAPTGLICKRARVRMCGGGGSGGVAATAGGVDGNNGTLSSFGGWTANPGIKGLLGIVSLTSANILGGAGGSGGSTGTGTLVRRISGGSGMDGAFFAHNAGTLGGPLTYSVLSPGGQNPNGGGGGKTPAANTGAGSAGVGLVAPQNTQVGQMSSGAGAGEWVEFIVPVTTATIAYVVGAGGVAPAGGIAGAAGVIEIEEQYQ